jgi:hypothetical protein
MAWRVLSLRMKVAAAVNILSRDGVTLDGFFIVDRIYWELTGRNYNTIANFHTLQITRTHAKSFHSAVSSPFVPW